MIPALLSHSGHPVHSARVSAMNGIPAEPRRARGERKDRAKARAEAKRAKVEREHFRRIVPQSVAGSIKDIRDALKKGDGE